jgi:hypothetical protein
MKKRAAPTESRVISRSLVETSNGAGVDNRELTRCPIDRDRR